MRAQKLRLAADHPNANPVVGLLGIVRVRNLRLVHPLIRVELVRLKHVRQPAGLTEAAVRQFVHSLHAAISLEIDLRTRIEHQALHAFLRERVGGHSSGCAGADDENVVFFTQPFNSPSRWDTNTVRRCRPCVRLIYPPRASTPWSSALPCGHPSSLRRRNAASGSVSGS